MKGKLNVPPAMRMGQLCEVDRQIRENTQELVEKIHRRAAPGEIGVLAEFVRTLFDHRATILHELGKEGISEADAYKMMQEAGVLGACRRNG